MISDLWSPLIVFFYLSLSPPLSRQIHYYMFQGFNDALQTKTKVKQNTILAVSHVKLLQTT